MDSIKRWLATLGLAQYLADFERNDIDLSLLSKLTDRDLRDLGIHSLGHRKKLLNAIAELNSGNAAVSASVAPEIQTFPQSSSTTEGERRQLTVLFCDMVGFTELASRVDPEVLQRIIRAYEDTCAAAITRFEGYVFQRLGDGIVAFFGYPLAHEGEAERAIHAGLEIIEALSKLDVPDVGHLAVRIGIATGLVVVSSVEKGAVGETMNLASRLQAIAEPGSIMVSERVHRLAGGSFDYEDLGEQTLKGIARPTRAYRILRVSEAASRFEAAHAEAGLTPLVGRGQEIGLLLERWQLAQDGEGQVVLLSGEPGIGKSRILSALRERLEAQGAKALRFQCSPYYVNSAFWPSIDNFERALKFGRHESPESKLDKLEALVVGHYGRPLGDVRFIASILSIPCEERYGAISMTPQKHKEETLRTLVDLNEAAARKQPSVMLFEDVHWADPTTLEVLALLIDRVTTIPLLIVLTHRPEFQSRWSEQGHVSALNLSKLTRTQSAAIISRLAGGKALPAALLEQILARTDGVPLFLEELTKSILESGELRESGNRYDYTGATQAISIPVTLRDSLMARLDRVVPGKEVAQIGAAIGREFSYELIAAVVPLAKAQREDGLERLTQSGLVFRRGTPPDALYTFKHALVQDAAYDSLLKSRRQILHRMIAEAMEKQFPERAGTEPEVVAHHYDAAGMQEQAVGYWLEAGQRAIERFANVEAVGHLTHGLGSLQCLPEGMERDRWELLLQSDLGTALGSSKGYTPPEVGQAFERARKLSERVGDTPRQFLILFGLWVYYVMRADYSNSWKLARQLLSLAQNANDPGAKVVAHQCTSCTAWFTGDPEQALHHGRLGCDLYRQAGTPPLGTVYGFDPGILCYEWVAWSLLILGFHDQANEIYAEGIRIAHEHGHPLTVATTKVHTACFYAMCEDPTAGLKFASEAASFCADHGILLRKVEAQILEGWALAETGQTEKGIEEMEAALAIWRQLGAQIWDPRWYLNLAQAYRCAGRLADSRNALMQAFHAANSNHEPACTAELHRMDGELWLIADNSPDDAERCFRTAIRVAKEQKAKLWEIRASNGLARLWQSQGKRKEAYDLLVPVYNWFTEGFDTKDLKEAKTLLSELA